uniref:Uncharacterized protein n=1 Tax=Timema monikensis TaxID=170555 RepID=A0A7R9HST9_9NEOP|nr:unnamed protein product [Timema monikensis]
MERKEAKHAETNKSGQAGTKENVVSVKRFGSGQLQAFSTPGTTFGRGPQPFGASTNHRLRLVVHEGGHRVILASFHLIDGLEMFLSRLDAMVFNFIREVKSRDNDSVLKQQISPFTDNLAWHNCQGRCSASGNSRKAILGTGEQRKFQPQPFQISTHAHLTTHALYSQKQADSFVTCESRLTYLMLLFSYLSLSTLAKDPRLRRCSSLSCFIRFKRDSLLAEWLFFMETSLVVTTRTGSRGLNSVPNIAQFRTRPEKCLTRLDDQRASPAIPLDQMHREGRQDKSSYTRATHCNARGDSSPPLEVEPRGNDCRNRLSSNLALPESQVCQIIGLVPYIDKFTSYYAIRNEQKFHIGGEAGGKEPNSP